MSCEHKRIMSVNCVLHCLDCGETLPEGFQTAKKPVKNAPQEDDAVNTKPKKRAAKKAV